jgi:hypothetical protein
MTELIQPRLVIADMTMSMLKFMTIPVPNCGCHIHTDFIKDFNTYVHRPVHCVNFMCVYHNIRPYTDINYGLHIEKAMQDMEMKEEVGIENAT